ncbi:MAG: hypothetical protein SP1CHLAM54_08950 [Chlamydiia bacterium]|nr:hypothetical protein [Chlamydiia bacterium]MCH9615801.1 hypothetical protein [Chlamydiia bacterium]MCH9628796.1 hypothetical protein [Chlamydiia bacterium]
MTKINLFSVKSSGEKFYHLARISHDHFENKSPLVIFAQGTALNYVDELLWRYPKNGFLPHTLHDLESLITITDKEPLLTEAQSIFNLSQMPMTGNHFQVYEFEDQTSPDKHKASKNRFSHYKEQGFHLISLA